MLHKGGGCSVHKLYPFIVFSLAALSFCCEEPCGETTCYAVFCTLGLMVYISLIFPNPLSCSWEYNGVHVS